MAEALAPDHSTLLIFFSTILALFFKPPAPEYSSTTVLPKTLSMKPPSSALKAEKRTASLSSIRGIFRVASKSCPASPPLTVDSPIPILPEASSPEASGLLVITRIVPVCDEAPNNVDCGPDRASIRAISTG